MKLVFSIALLSLASTLLYAQPPVKIKHAPAVVDAAFHKDFPEAKDVRWMKEGKSYESEFKSGTMTMSVEYDTLGVLTEIETPLPQRDLPVAAVDYMKQKFPGEEFKEMTKILELENGFISYEIEIKDKEVIFDKDGKFVAFGNE